MTEHDVVLVTSRTFGSATTDYGALLGRDGVEVVHGAAGHEPAHLAAVLPRVTQWIAGVGPVTEEHLAVAGRLRLVARFGTGVDAVDLAAARRHGVLVTSTPGVNADAVADFALAMILAGLTRLVGSAPRGLRSALDSTVTGLWGLGQVGGRLCVRLRALGLTVLAHDPFVPPAAFARAGAEPCDARELAVRCDVVSLHLPGGAPVVTRSWLSGVRRRPVLVNTARSSLVDPLALSEALRAGRLSGYLTDVDDAETLSAALTDEELRGGVFATPHLAAHTREAVDAMAAAVYEQVRASLAGVTPPGGVALPIGHEL